MKLRTWGPQKRGECAASVGKKGREKGDDQVLFWTFGEKENWEE